MKKLIILFLILYSSGAIFYSLNNNSKNVPLEAFIESAKAEELDLFMTSWFDEFHRSQSSGVSFNEADQIATAYAFGKLGLK